MGPLVMPTTPAAPAQQAGNLPPAVPFDRSTRLSFIPLAAIARPTGGGASPEVQLPTSGLLGAIHLAIRGTIGGAVGTVNALGMASIIKRITLRLNNGTVVWSMTGPNYHYLYRDFIDSGYIDVVGQTNARDAITATSAILDMVIPISVNEQSTLGMILLQNRQTILSLAVEWEADTTVTSTGTFSNFLVTPTLLNFSVPPDPRSLPKTLRYLHIVTDQSQVVSGAGDVVFDIPRGNTYMNIIVGAGINAAGADSWSRAQLRVNQTQYLFDMTPNSMDMLFRRQCGRARELGMIPFVFDGTSGLGKYGTPRDLYDSNRTTDFQFVVTVTGALTMYVVMEQIVDLGPGMFG